MIQVQVKRWDEEAATLVEATIEVDRTDDDEVAVYLRDTVGHDGNPTTFYVERAGAGALIGLLSVHADGPTSRKRP